MLLPFWEQLSQWIKEILLKFHSHSQLSLLYLWIFSDTVYYGYFFIQVSYDSIVVLWKIVNETFAGVNQTLAPESVDCGHFGVQLQLFFGLENNFLQEVKFFYQTFIQKVDNCAWAIADEFG